MKVDFDRRFRGIDGKHITAAPKGPALTLADIIMRSWNHGFRPADESTSKRLYGLAQKGGRRRISSRDLAALRAALGAYQTNALLAATLAAKGLTVLDEG